MDVPPESPILMQPGDDIKPNMTKETACQLVEELYGLQVSAITELNAYDDKNFHIIPSQSTNPFIKNVSTEGYVLKVMNTIDSKNLSFIDGQNKLLLFLQSHDLPAPIPVQNKHGEFFSLENIHSIDGAARAHFVRLLQFQPGKIFKSVSSCRRLYYEAGAWLAKLDNVLMTFHHPVFDTHTTIWHVKSVPLVKSYLYVLDDISRRSLVAEVVEKFNNDVIPKIPELNKGMIHGDFNEQNILVQPSGNGEWSISAILDFGDCNYACYLFEIGTALCYMMLEARRNGQDMLECGGDTLRGYQSVRSLTSVECSLLKVTICSRLCQSLVLGLYSQSVQPNNAYIGDTQANGWAVLSDLWKIPDEVLLNTWVASK